MTRLYNLRNFEDSIRHAVELNKELLIDASNEPLRSGTDTKGVDLGDYSPNYAKFKGRIRPVDLRLTGDFYNKRKINTVKGFVSIESTDPDKQKVNWLLDNYGEDILGLPYKEFMEIISDDFIKHMQSKI